MAKNYDFSINVTGIVDLKDLHNQLQKEKFNIDIKLTPASMQVINDLKQLAKDLSNAFNSMGSFASKTANISNSISNTSSTPIISSGSNATSKKISELEIARFEKAKETLISQITNKLNMGDKSGLFNANNQMYDGAKLKREYEDILASAKKLTTTTTDYKKELVEAQTKVVKLNPAYQSLSKDVQKTFSDVDNKLDIFWKKLANAAYYKAIFILFNTLEKGLNSLITKTIDINSELRDINKVLDMQKDQLEDLSVEANKLAMAYSRTTIEILKNMEYFAKAGFGRSQIIELAELSTKLQNVGDLSSELASSFLIATNAAFQFNGSVQELSKSIDIVNNLSNNAAYTVEQLSEAIKVGGAVAYSSGLSMEEFAAMITTVGEATQRSGREVGNGIKTILLRLTQVRETGDEAIDVFSKVDEVLQSVGITIKDTPNSFRPPMETLTELANKWETLSDVQQRAISYNLAGVYRSNILESFLTNIKDYEDNLYIALNSTGSATRENKLYMDSLEASLKKLTATWEQFIVKAKASKTIKFVVDVLTIAVKNLNNILTSLGITLGGYILVKVVSLLMNLGKTKTAIDGATQSVGKFSKVLNSSLGVIGLIATALSVIIGLLDKWANSAETAYKKQKEILDSSLEQVKESLAEYGQLNILIRQYKNLQEQYAKTGEGIEQLQDLQEELNNSYKSQANRIDLVNGKLEDNLALLQEVKKQELQNIIDKGMSAYNISQGNMQSTVGEKGLYGFGGIGKMVGEIFGNGNGGRIEDAFDKAGINIVKYFDERGENVADFMGEGDLRYKLGSNAQELRDAINRMSAYEYRDMLNMVLDELNKKSAEGDHSVDKNIEQIVEFLKPVDEFINNNKGAIDTVLEAYKSSIQMDLSDKIVGLQGYEKTIFDDLSKKAELKDASQESQDKYRETISNLISTVDNIDTNNFEEKWKALLGIFPDLTDKDKEKAIKYVANLETQLSNLIDEARVKMDGFNKDIKEMESIEKATSKMFDVRRSIAEESGLVGDDYKNFAKDTDGKGNTLGLITDPKLKKLAEEMQNDYLKYLEDIKNSEENGLKNQDTITKLYENQVALKEKELKILQKELEVQKKQEELNRLQNERTQVTFINGQRVYTVDHSAISKAQEELDNSLKDKNSLESQLDTDKSIYDLEKDRLLLGDSMQEFENAISKGDAAIVEFGNNLNNISNLLVNGLGDSLTKIIDMVNKNQNIPPVNNNNNNSNNNSGDSSQGVGINIGNVTVNTNDANSWVASLVREARSRRIHNNFIN